MKDVTSEKQKVLRLIWDCITTNDVMTVFSEHKHARDLSLIKELINESNNAVPSLEKHLLDRANDLDTIHKLVNDFSNVDNLDKLTDWFATSQYAFSEEIPNCIRAYHEDCSSAGLTEVCNKYDRAFIIISELTQLINSLQKHIRSEEKDGSFFEKNEMLCSSAISRWLELRGQLGDESSVNVKRIREYLVYMCALQRNLSNISKDLTGHENDRVRFAMPTRWFESEHWYLIHHPLNEEIEKVMRQNLAGVSRLDNIENAVLGFAREKFHIKDEDFLLTYLYCYILSNASSPAFDGVILRYRNLINIVKNKPLPKDHIATYILRYGMAVMRTKIYYMPEEAILVELLELLTSALSIAEPNRSPKLVRDLFFTKARINEVLHELPIAVSNYRDGLSIKGATHEVEPRAMAMSDLANTLIKMAPMTEARDREIISLFEQAIDILKNTMSPDLTAKTLINAAIYQSERTFGDPAINIERAISYLLRAREISNSLLDKMNSDKSDDSLIHHDVVIKTKILCASVYMTHGNLLKIRKYGYVKKQQSESSIIPEDQPKLIQISKLYEDGIAIIKGIPCELQAFLQLNLANLYVDLYKETEQENYLQRAQYSYDESIDLFTDARFKFRAIIARAGIELAAISTTTERIDNELKNIQVIFPPLASLKISLDTAKAHQMRGFLYRRRHFTTSEIADLSSSIIDLKKAFIIYTKESHLESAIDISRPLTASLIEKYFQLNDQDDLLEAERTLSEVSRMIDILWNSSQSVEWHQTVAMQHGDLFADLAWCRYKLGRSAATLRATSCLAKARELYQNIIDLPHNNPLITEERALFLEHIRRQMRADERMRWQVQEKAGADGSIISDLSNFQKQTDANRAMRSLVVPPEIVMSAESLEHRLQVFQSCTPRSIIIDYTISRWGGFAILRLQNGDDRIINIDLKLAELRDFLFNEDGGWFKIYAEYSKSITRRSFIEEYELKLKAWEEKLDELICFLSKKVIQPLFETEIQQLTESTVFICPGSLAGLPLHAASRLSDEYAPLFRNVQGFAYALTPALLPIGNSEAKKTDRVLCLLSDPAETEERVLKNSQREIVQIASYYAKLGKSVSIVASVRQRFGLSAIENYADSLNPLVNIIEEHATPEWLAKNFEKFDIIFYSGHGLAQGLVLSDSAGKPQIFSIGDALTLPSLSKAPIVHLSACETAHETISITGEVFSFASWLLRAGAHAVIGSSWDAIDRWSAMFSLDFHRALEETKSLTVSYCLALQRLSVTAPRKVDWCNFTLYLGGGM